MAFLYGHVIMIDDEEREERRTAITRYRRIRRTLRDTLDPFSVTDEEFVRNFRLNKFAARDLIDLLQPTFIREDRMAGIPVFIRVLAALCFFGTGSYQRSIGNSMLTALSQPSVSRCIKMVSNKIVRHCLRNWIKFPRNGEERRLNKEGFLRNRMPHIIGVVDGTHVAIVKPHEDEQTYVNRKGYHSINVQIVCDNDLKIINVVARWPGSTHDSFIWNNSIVGRAMKGNFEDGDNETRILGDSGYPSLPWLLVPLRNPDAPNEVRFNNTFKVARSCVERCIGVLKGRFRCLLSDRVLHYSPPSASRIIMACSVLHNICLRYNVDEVEPVWDDMDLLQVPQVEDDRGDHAYRNLGNEWRRQYINENF